jgi:hypothetical protein
LGLEAGAELLKLLIGLRHALPQFDDRLIQELRGVTRGERRRLDLI